MTKQERFQQLHDIAAKACEAERRYGEHSQEAIDQWNRYYDLPAATVEVK
jgi:hypothetical protein